MKSSASTRFKPLQRRQHQYSSSSSTSKTDSPNNPELQETHVTEEKLSQTDAVHRCSELVCLAAVSTRLLNQSLVEENTRLKKQIEQLQRDLDFSRVLANRAQARAQEKYHLDLSKFNLPPHSRKRSRKQR